MGYTKQTWVDNESPVNASRMNHIEDGIKDNSDRLDQVPTVMDDYLSLHSVNPVKNKAIAATMMQIKPNDQLTPTRTVAGQWINASGSAVSNSGWCYKEFSVSGNLTFFVCGTSINRDNPYIIFYNGDTIISMMIAQLDDGESYPKGVGMQMIETPAGCTKVIVNGQQTSLGSVTYRYYPNLFSAMQVVHYPLDNQAEHKDLAKNVDQWTKINVAIQPKIVTVHNITDGSIHTVEDAWAQGVSHSHIKISINKQKKYRVTGRIYHEDYYQMVYYADKDDKYVGMTRIKIADADYPISSLTAIMVNYELTDIPENTRYIYVNGMDVSATQGTNMPALAIEEATKRDFCSLVDNDTNKIGICLGDSVTEGDGVCLAGTPAISPYAYPAVIGKILNCKVYNMGIGGSTYTQASPTRGIDFLDVVDALVTRDFTNLKAAAETWGMKSSTKKAIEEMETYMNGNVNIDFITIAFGNNDWQFGRTYTEVVTAMKQGIQSLQNAYPYARIYVFTQTMGFDWGGNNETTDTYVNPTSGETLPQHVEAVKQAAKEMHVPCKDLYWESGMNENNRRVYTAYQSGWHLNMHGYRLFGEKLAKFINSN